MHQSRAAVERFKLHSIPELLGIAEPEWLIEKLFSVGSLVGLYGPSGHGKSFLALDWALSVAAGMEWFGRAVGQGPVVYVAAEGGRSIGQRVRAWRRERGVQDIPPGFFVLESVQVKEREDLELLSAQIAKLDTAPQLIVLDTLARCFVGGDENSAEQMGEFVDGLAWLQRETEAAVMVLHHTGKQDKDLERGSSAFRAAADAMIRVSMDQNRFVTIKDNKQKDAEEFADIRLRLHQVPLADASGRETTSCVLAQCGEVLSVADDVPPPHLRATLRALAEHPEQATRKQWASRAGLPERTFDAHRSSLVARGYVETVAHGTYQTTAKGRAFVETAATARKPQLVVGSSVPSRSAATATPPLGVAVAAEAANDSAAGEANHHE